MGPTLTVDDLRVDVVLSARRRTMELSVERDGALVIRAPERATRERLKAFIREKRAWVYRKVAEKEAIRPPTPLKEFVSGEGFPYLGRSYRLLLVTAQDVPLRLKDGRFRLLRSEVRHGRAHFIRWYTERGKSWLRQRAADLAPRIGVLPSRVEVQDLRYRWASCSSQGTIRFHWATVLLPPNVIDYLLVHELVHLREPRHTTEFWRRIERAVPDFKRKKKWIAEHGLRLASI